ncbi:MAG: SGNH/GDSL hydrolase family protein [Rhodospirillales bacterium]|nr:SGNH/GDSL hydrolase family protein [Rhodospirillales bacterium]
MPRSRSPLARVIAVNLGLLAAVIVAAELIFGTWLFGPSFGALNLPRDIQRRFDVSALRPADGPVLYTRDRWALRGRYENPGSIGILAVGGSTTNEANVSDGETWTDRLGRRFAEAGIDLSVVNAGAEGQSTVGHIRNFETWFTLIPGLRFRYLLAYVGVNDMALGPRGADAIQAAYDRAESPERMRRLRQYIANQSALYRLWRTLRGVREASVAKVTHARIERAKTAWVEHPGPEIAEPAQGSELAARLEGYRSRIAELIRRTRASGAEAIVVTQSRSNWRREGGKLLFALRPDGKPDVSGYAETALFNRSAMAACQAAKAICLDLGAEIEFRPGDFYDHVHTTPEGSARIADYLFARLKDRVR